MRCVPSCARIVHEEERGWNLHQTIHGKQSKAPPGDVIVTSLRAQDSCCLRRGLIEDAAREEERTQQLLCRVAEGNTPAFWKLWDLHKGHLYHLCLWQMGGIQEDAEDALSRAMLRALEKLPNNACKIGNFKAWLSRLTLNLCVDIHRERGRHLRRLESIENSPPGARERLPAGLDSPEEGLINREVFAYVCSAVDDLPPRLREPFVLRFFQEMDYREIADCLILSTDNVRKRIQQARGILRLQLNGFLQGSVGRHTNLSRTSGSLAAESRAEATTLARRRKKHSRRLIYEVLNRLQHSERTVFHRTGRIPHPDSIVSVSEV